MSQPVIIFTVTNTLSYDQRMQRICGTLAKAGYKILLVGRSSEEAPTLGSMPFEQLRLAISHQKGKRFYAEYNWKLYDFLCKSISDLQKKGHKVAVCAIDLDTILPCFFVSKKFSLVRVYDAHELFTELIEVKSRKLIHRIWLQIERFAVPKFSEGYTVNEFIANEFHRRYGVNYAVVRNLPVRKKESPAGLEVLPKLPLGRFLLYQGAVNEGRSFETLIPAMKEIPIPLVIAGTGNFLAQTKTLVATHGVAEKVIFLGDVLPQQLQAITPKAFVGLTLFEPSGLNQYYSLANRFFDYIQAGIPQICVGYPEYKTLCKTNSPALLIDDTSSKTIAEAVNKLLNDAVLHNLIKTNADAAAEVLCWENEAIKLIEFWKRIFTLV